jgi:hypothetical protein
MIIRNIWDMRSFAMICAAFIYGFSYVWFFMYMPTGMAPPLIPGTAVFTDGPGNTKVPVMIYKNQTRDIDRFSNGTHTKQDPGLRAKAGPIYEQYGAQVTGSGNARLPYDFRCPDGIYPCQLTYSYDYQDYDDDSVDILQPVNQYRSWQYCLRVAFEGMLGAFDTSPLDKSANPELAYVYFVVFSFFTVILLFNLLLAILGDSFATVADLKEEEGLRERLNICLEFLDEYTNNSQERLESKTKWVHQLMSPDARYADGELGEPVKGDKKGSGDNIERVNTSLRKTLKQMDGERQVRLRGLAAQVDQMRVDLS